MAKIDLEKLEKCIIDKLNTKFFYFNICLDNRKTISFINENVKNLFVKDVKSIYKKHNFKLTNYSSFTNSYDIIQIEK